MSKAIRMSMLIKRNLFHHMIILGATITMAIGSVASLATAAPIRDGCYPDCDTPTTPPQPPPAITTITQLSPTFGWSGDTMTLTGVHFTGATVTVGNLAATIVGRTDTRLTFIVPTIMSTVVGPVQMAVLISGPSGAAGTSFMLSPTLSVVAGSTFGINSQFGQGTDGSAWASVDIDRASGFVHGQTTVKNTQFWLSLTINVSTVLLDENGIVIGFTPPQPLTSTGFFFHWPSGDTTTVSDWNIVTGPNPGVGPKVRSAQILLVRDHDAELLSTLSNAVDTAKTIASVISTLAPFLG